MLSWRLFMEGLLGVSLAGIFTSFWIFFANHLLELCIKSVWVRSNTSMAGPFKKTIFALMVQKRDLRLKELDKVLSISLLLTHLRQSPVMLLGSHYFAHTMLSFRLSHE